MPPPSHSDSDRGPTLSFEQAGGTKAHSELCQRNSYINLYPIKAYAVCVCDSVSVFNASNSP